MPEYMHLGSTPDATRRLAKGTFAKKQERARTFDTINWLYINSEKPDSDRSRSRLLRDLLIGPWLDVDAAVQDLLMDFHQNPALANHPRTLLIEDSLSYHIAPMLPWLKDLTVLVLSGLDFNQLPPHQIRKFWHPLDRCTFKLRTLEIANCASTVDQLSWVISLFTKNRLDNLRIKNIHFHSTGHWVPLFAFRSSAKRALRVDKLYVGADSRDPTMTVALLEALGNLPLSYLCTSLFTFQTMSIMPDVVTALNDLVSAQGSAIRTLTFHVPRDFTVGDPGSPLLGKSLRLYGLDKFRFDCPIKNGVWNEYLLRLYLNTLTHYSSGLKFLRITLIVILDSWQLLQMTNNSVLQIRTHLLWEKIESLIAARKDIEGIDISIGWCSDRQLLEGGNARLYKHRGYYPVTVHDVKTRREFLETTIRQLFPNVVARISAPANRYNKLAVRLFCNNTKTPCFISPFEHRLFEK